MTETAHAQDRGAAAEKASEVKEQAREQAQQVAGQARDRVREQVDQRSTQAGEQVRQQADDLRSVSQQLREQGKDGPAKITDQVADRADRVGSWLHDSDADRILGDVEDFARRNPWAVAAGGVVIGLLASRALKASSTRRFEERSSAGQLPVRTPSRPAPPVDQPLTTAGAESRFERPASTLPPEGAL